jgi:hypothetical protein
LVGLAHGLLRLVKLYDAYDRRSIIHKGGGRNKRGVEVRNVG